jgi:hypothetical protein
MTVNTNQLSTEMLAYAIRRGRLKPGDLTADQRKEVAAELRRQGQAYVEHADELARFFTLKQSEEDR